MEKIDAPMSVWISEDGSGIFQKVAYDSISNKLVGINLQFDENTGMPITSQFIARSLSDIENHMNELSYLVYAVMAQPIKRNAPPF